MDITQQFRASVMTVKLQRKAQLTAKIPDSKQRVPPKGGAASATSDEFARQAKDVCNKITTLRNVLLENRTAYMRIGQHLKSAASMTDEQRDLIDRESEKFVTYYTQFLAQMRSDWKRVKRKPQERAHIEAVLDLLVNYLHSVQQIYLDQKKYRVQHELETYRLLKLAGDKKKIPVRPAGADSGLLRRRRANNNDSSDDDDDAAATAVERAAGGADGGAKATAGDDWNDSWEWGDDDDDGGAVNEDELLARQQQSLHTSKVRKKAANGHAARQPNKSGARRATLSKQSSKVALDEDIEKSAQELDDEDDCLGLSPDDVQMYEQENMQLYNEYQGLSEEVEQIEKNVVDIAQLQDIFTEKVHMQQHNIERIANAVVGATENVKDANEQIRQATQRNAGIRVWSLFFLLVMSFSLLFLDWYYD